LLATLLALLSTGCTFSSYSSKTADTAISSAELWAKIKTMVNYKEISYQTEDRNTNGFKTNTLSVKIVNDDNLPQTDDSLKALSKRIAKELKAAAKGPANYDKYEVIYNNTDNSGLITRTMNASYAYKKGDL
jgi:hypothetical protein